MQTIMYPPSYRKEIIPINLKESFGKQYKIFEEESWWHEPKGEQKAGRVWSQEMRGQNGKVYAKDATALLAYTDRPKTRQNLKQMGLTIHQWGDEEAVFVFQPERLEEVAGVLRLRRKRRMSQEQRNAAISRLAMTRGRATNCL